MRRLLCLLLAACVITAGSGAWGYWSVGSGTGGNGAAASTSVNQGATPTASAAGNAVTVSWAPTTLTTGQAVTGYTVKRYAGSTAQAILTACTGTITGTSCIENNVPTGVWTYSVTPVFATNWAGVESAKSSNVVVGNVAPVAVADGYSVAEDAVLSVAASGVLVNDSDPNSDPLTAILASGVANGALTFNANGGFTYTPNPNFNGSDSFSYKANDGTQDSNIVTVTVSVTAVNDAPVNAVPGPQQTPKNTNRVFSSANNNPISISDVDASGSVQVQLTATNGTVTLPVLTDLTVTVGDGTSDATMTFTGTIANINTRLDGATFIPTDTFTGAATLQIVTSDQGSTGSGGTKTDSDTVTINVNSLGIFTANQDIGSPALTGSSAYSAGTYTVAGGGWDIWNNSDQFQYLYRALTGDGRLTAKVVSELPAGTNAAAKAGLMFRESVAAGSKHAMADVQQTAGSEFLYRLTTDGASSNNSGTAGIIAPYWLRITRVGDAITAQRSPDGVTWTNQGTAQTVSMTTSVTVGLAVTAHDNAKLLTATYDNVALTTPPTAVGGAYSVNEDATLNVGAASGVLANDTDPESNALTAVLVSGTSGLTLNANGSFAYVPPVNFTGAASFTYKANDGVFDSNTVTVNLTVNPANEVPSFTKGANQSVSAGSGAQTVASWATAISQGTGESGQLVDFVVTNDNNSLFSVQPAVSAAGTLTYTPAGTNGSATVSVRIHDNGGTANGGSDLSAVQTFTITTTPDTAGPTGGSVDASGLVGTGSRYAASTTLSLVLAKGTDPSGVATTGNLLKRATATLTSAGTPNGTCGTFGAYSLVSGGTDPVSPKSDTVTDQACYSYQYVVLDTLGNPTTYTSPDIKVDLTAPAAPSLTHSAFTNTYWSSGAVVYYRSAAASGSFTTTSTATDTTSGIASHTFPTLGTNWTSTPGALGVNTYSWSGAPAVPGAKNITATNHATGASGNTSFTPTADDTAPSAGTVTPPNATQSSTSVSIAYTTGTDGGSGLGTRLLQRQSATLTGTTCGSYGGWTTAVSNPGSSPFADTVTGGFCYQYQYVVSDNVGNTHTATSGNIVKVTSAYSDTILATSGLVSYWRLGEALSSSPMVDSKGTNNGTYFGSPTMASTGAIAGSSDTAVQLNDTSQYATAARQIQNDFSIEFWFKSTQSYYEDWGFPRCTQWWQGASLIDAETSGSSNDFGISLCEGKVIAGVGDGAGGSDVSMVTSGTYNNGAWHHVVFTRTQSSGALALYVDGAAAGTATGSTNALTSQATLTFGRSSWGGHAYAGSMDEIAVYSSVLSGATVSGHYQSGTSGPTGGSVDATGLVGTGSRYAASTTLSLALAKGTDPDGVATTGNTLLRATATLTNGTCGTFGTYTLIAGGTDPASPKTDTVSDQACYSYQYVVLDTLGNPTTYTSPDIKVDLTAPAAPTLAHSAFTNTYWSSGTVVYYRSAAASGSFTTTSTATDTKSGIASHTFSTLGTNWTSTPGALGVNTYSWSGAPAVPGAKNVTATNNATGVSGSTSFTPTADDTAPSAGTVTPPDATQASTSVSVAYTTGTDGGSGLGTRLLQRQSATLTGTTCGSYGAWTTAATNPGSSPFSDTVTAGNCHKYQYVVSDNVGNTHTATSTNVVKVTAGSTTVKAQYKNNEPAAPTDNSIQPHLQLVNTGASGVDLGTITVRYWFTKEAGASTFSTNAYWATVGASNVTHSVVAVSPARTGADSYLLVGFASSTLAAGASTAVELGFNKTDWANFAEADDYSYGTGTSYTDSTKVTVYQGGTLIWGTEP